MPESATTFSSFISPPSTISVIAFRNATNIAEFVHPGHHVIFDCVVSTVAFSHFYDARTALNEVYRILKPEGHCIIIDHKKPNLIIRVIFSWLRLLANYWDIKDIKSFLLAKKFKIITLKETNKYFIAHITPAIIQTVRK